MSNEEMFRRLAEGQLVLQQTVIEMGQAYTKLAQTASVFIESSNKRLERIEANLDMLIAGILHERKNGGKKK